MSKGLRVTLYLVSAYLAFFGILFAFAPRVFEQMTGSKLLDPELTLLYGQYTLTFAYVAFAAARRKAPNELSLTVLVVTAGNAVVFGYLLTTGRQPPSQAGPPLVVNAVFTVLLLLFRSRAEAVSPRGR